jgi:hypothetical protein
MRVTPHHTVSGTATEEAPAQSSQETGAEKCREKRVRLARINANKSVKRLEKLSS